MKYMVLLQVFYAVCFFSRNLILIIICFWVLEKKL